MRINNKSLLLVLLLFITPFINLAVSGQSPALNVDPSDTYREKLFVTTDREIYITGEEVRVKVYEMDGLSCLPVDFSKIVYLEMLNAGNNPVRQAKIRVEGTSGSAAFRLSDTLTSGDYLVRAYTGWMENFPEDLFAYTTITVINPFRDLNDLVTDVAGQPDGNGLSYTESKEFNCNETVEGQVNITAKTDRKKYGTRDRVKIDISVSGTDGKPVEADLSVSVMKSYLAGTDRKYLVDGTASGGSANDQPRSPSHLPDLEGELIRGVIFNKITNRPLNETNISLSFVGKIARCQFTRTNAKGEFFFVVKDQDGLAEIVIQPLIPDISGSYVELHQPFCNTFNGFRPPVFELDSILAGKLNDAVIAMQVSNNYEQARDKSIAPPAFKRRDFFGGSDRIVDMADFIELTNIREVVRELLPEVTLFTKDKKAALKVVSSNPYQIFSNPALVLFDGVPVFDIEELMKVSAKDLETIEIINTRYFYSDYVFEGIISFISKEGILNAIESSSSVFRQVYEGCLKDEVFYSPDYSIDAERLSRIPDFRNTLYWNPDVVTSANSSAAVEFYTSDDEMEYTVIIEGFTSEGTRLHYTAPLQVK